MKISYKGSHAGPSDLVCLQQQEVSGTTEHLLPEEMKIADLQISKIPMGPTKKSGEAL